MKNKMKNTGSILEILQKEHTEVLDLFAQMEMKEDLDEKQKIFKKIKKELTNHNHAEERTFYKKIKEESGEVLLATRGQEEHDLAESCMDELESEPDETKWCAKLQILKALVEDHILAEEEDIFEVARKIYSQKELEKIGNEFREEKKKISGNGGFLKNLWGG